LTLRAVDDKDAEIVRLQARIRGLENELKKARARAYYSEGVAREAAEEVCPMAHGDPHRMCSLAEGLSDALARAQAKHPDLSAWLEESSEEDVEWRSNSPKPPLGTEP
jgi:hypothetical protein